MSDDKPTIPNDSTNVEAAEAALDRLAARLAPPSIGARIRRLLPKIEAAIEAGATHVQIVETLRETGIDVSLNTFRSALYRARKKTSKRSRKESRAGDSSGGGTASPSSGKTSTAASDSRDPLAVPEKPKSFDWDPTERPNITFINEDDDESSS